MLSVRDRIPYALFSFSTAGVACVQIVIMGAGAALIFLVAGLGIGLIAGFWLPYRFRWLRSKGPAPITAKITAAALFICFSVAVIVGGRGYLVAWSVALATAALVEFVATGRLGRRH
jgi:hypothetical protein